MQEIYMEMGPQIMAEKIDELIKNGVITKDRKIVFFGIGGTAYVAKRLLKLRGFDTYAIVDNDESKVIETRKKQRTLCNNLINAEPDVIISSPTEVLLPKRNDFFIFTSAHHAQSMGKELKEMGYEEGIDFCCPYDYYAETEFTRKVQDLEKIDLIEMKSIMTEILKYVDEYCNENHIRYWICAGTLLGAIRHKGFIPWDDDIDIVMPWDDYLRFIDSFDGGENYGIVSNLLTSPEKYNADNTRIVDKRTLVRENIWPCRRVLSCYIDVQPLIGLPDHEKEQRAHLSKYYEYHSEAFNRYYEARNTEDFEDVMRIRQHQNALREQYSFDGANYVAQCFSVYKKKDVYPKDVFNETIRIPFENIYVNAPADYIEYLDQLYGKGWKELPSEKNRASHHLLEAYWRNEAR